MLAGWSGVDFFFVLSGFLITFIHAEDIGRPSRVLVYTIKRLRRILPVYWIYTAGALAIHILIYLSTDKTLIYWNSLDLLSIAHSIFLWPTDLVAGQWPILPVAWTLWYELLFYALFGVAIILGRLASAVVLCAWIAFISLNAAGVFGQFGPPVATLLGDRNLEFLAGCGIGFYLRDRRRPRSYATLLGVTGLALLTVAWWNALTGYSVIPRLEAIQFGVPYALIIFALASMDLSTPVRESPTSAVLRFLGDASYSIYLIHTLPIFLWAIAANNMGIGPEMIVVVAVLVGVGSGVVAFILIERPLMSWLRTATNQRSSPSNSSKNAHRL